MVYIEITQLQMDQLEDLLPGIEDYLCNVLANESLSEYAEEQRQYFLERLDIIKLPPSIPPRPQSLGVRLYPVHSSPPLSNRDSIRSLEQDDFAAYQRELSRALLDPDSSSNLTEVKVYDDIDTADSSVLEISPCKTEEEEESMYEIPQRNLSDSGYEKALELSPISKSSSSQEQLSSSCNTGTPVPPPLPPRGERTGSDAASRGSIGSMLEYQSPDVLAKPKLYRESSVPSRLTQSTGKSTEDLMNHEYYDGASCESLDEVDVSTCDRSPSSLIQLPRPIKRKHRSNHRKLGKSLTSLWEITQPFSMLEDIVLSGELHHKSKLTWTRKIVALTMGRLVCYKSDKTDSRPSFVILLSGYKATSHKREGRRSFEIHLDHDNFESHVFLVDFKEWAETWCEHINAASKGQRASGPNVHLARGSLMANQDSTYQIAHTNVQLSNSNSSLVSYDGLDSEPGTVKIKKRDPSGTKSAKMGAFAFKATQFFESFSKKSSIKKSSGSVSESFLSSDRGRRSSGSQSSICDVSERLEPLTPDSSEKLESLTPDIAEDTQEIPVEVKKHIKHQGYVDIYSSFNKRKWGKRWCLIHENNFECYRTQQSDVCELEFLLKNCKLRRAIEETKSELGLMLLENNREKITIEPVNWNELGSWLRVLMQETSTPVIPHGLEGYMDDTHPYHEAVEITRLPENPTKPNSLTLNANTRLTMSDNSMDSRVSDRSRDSGICSAGFSDDGLSSQDRKSTSPQVHPCFNDSSLPRVSVCDSGAIYTQVRKSNATGSRTKSDKISSLPGNQSTGSQTVSDESVGNTQASETGADNEKSFLDFDNPPFEREESLVDQIMSHLNTRLSSSESPTFGSELNEMSDNSGKRKSDEFHPNDKTLSPIKSEENTLTDIDPVFLCSSFVEDTNTVSTTLNVNRDIDEHNVNTDDDKLINQQSMLNNLHNKPVVTVRRHPSTVSRCEENVEDTLMELRTRLVQLKKDRISIRDRKHQIESETDKDFLEAEYERLNRECKKVSDEINLLELHLNGKTADSPEQHERSAVADDEDNKTDTVDAHHEEHDVGEEMLNKDNFNDIVLDNQEPLINGESLIDENSKSSTECRTGDNVSDIDDNTNVTLANKGDNSMSAAVTNPNEIQKELVASGNAGLYEVNSESTENSELNKNDNILIPQGLSNNVEIKNTPEHNLINDRDKDPNKEEIDQSESDAKQLDEVLGKTEANSDDSINGSCANQENLDIRHENEALDDNDGTEQETIKKENDEDAADEMDTNKT